MFKFEHWKIPGCFFSFSFSIERQETVYFGSPNVCGPISLIIMDVCVFGNNYALTNQRRREFVKSDRYFIQRAIYKKRRKNASSRRIYEMDQPFNAVRVIR